MTSHAEDGCNDCPPEAECNLNQASNDHTVTEVSERNDDATDECGVEEDLRWILDIAESRNPEFFQEVISLLEDAPGTDDVVRLTQGLLEDLETNGS